MLEHGYCCSIEFVDQGAGGIDIEQVVVADFLAVKLVELCFEIAVIGGCLVRILAVAK